MDEFNVLDIIFIFWGLKECYEVYYGVKIVDSVLVVVVMLFNCYISDCFLLDKVIDLVDEVVVKLKMEIIFKLEELDEVDWKIF